MGKSQYKKKTQGRRHNPLRVPDAHLGSGKGEGKADPAKEKQMLPILNKLKSPEYADRTWACAAICNLIQNDAATRRLFQGRNVVGELIERLSDSVDEVLVEASGALRNLAIDGGHELCGEMANKGIMSHLTVLIEKISSTIDSLSTATQAVKLSNEHYQNRKHLLSLAENVISLLWSLAEANPKTLSAVNALGCEGLLIKVLAGRENLGLGVSLAASQALYSLTQDNPPFRKAIVQYPNALETIISVIEQDHAPIESSQNAIARKGKGKDKQVNGDAQNDLPDGRALLRRVLISGVIRNCVLVGSRTDERVNVAGLTSGTILPLVNGLLDVNLTNIVNRVLELVQQVPKEGVPNLNKDMKTDHKSSAEVSLERIERNLTTVAIASEVLTNICAGLEEEEEPMVNTAEAFAEEEDEDEDMEELLADEDLIEMGREPGLEIGEESFQQSPKVNPGATLSHLLSTLQLPIRLTALSQLTTLSFPPSNDQPSLHPPTTSVLSVLHIRALEALNNLLLTTAVSLPSNASAASQISGTVPVQQIWSKMFEILTTIGSEPDALKMKGQEMRVEVLEMALGCIWGTSKIAPEQLDIENDHIQTLIDSTSVLKSDVAKVRVIEALASLATRENVSEEQNKIIGTWLLQQLTSTNPSPEILIAILNAIIDIYSDETKPYDQPVFVQGGFLEQLSGNVAKVRVEIKKIDKRKDRQLRTQGEEVYENLTAFIKYRRSLRR
ncbi:uncharacterized protein L201_002943 [Kwoniella dendrophila CBS 6074]|uniref:SYO1-like TPR repeats domain-containing protein n=1 Tax=Kwoniella dendrophila CBS 6074 TaxID=1295534 RepID=A0AAX4JTX7_9TREE